LPGSSHEGARPYIRTFARLLCISVLAAIIPIETSKSELRFHRNPPWITEALASGALNQKQVDLLNRSLGCQPGGWSRAVNWLQSNSLSLETVPEFGNDNFWFKVARGVLKTFQDVTITIRMKIWSASLVCQIEIEQYGHEGNIGLNGEQQVRNAKIFADFKSYMLEASDNK